MTDAARDPQATPHLTKWTPEEIDAMPEVRPDDSIFLDGYTPDCYIFFYGSNGVRWTVLRTKNGLRKRAFG